MPNHVTTRMTVTGPEAAIAGFYDRHMRLSSPEEQGDEKVLQFEFSTIVPRPKIVDETESGAESELGLAALVGEVVHHDFVGFWPRTVAEAKLSGPPIYHAAQVRAFLEKHNPKALEKGRKLCQCIVETGYPDWYRWSIANWGTKWGSYSNKEIERVPGRYVLKFETAWSFPEPIFRKLAEMWPMLTFAVVAYDEGDNFACVGEFNGANNFAKVECTPDLYEQAYGHKRDEEEDS